MPDTERMCYVGRAPCGCARVCVVDDPAYARKTALEVADAIAAGLTISRMPVEEARALITRCPHKEPKRRKKAAAQGALALGGAG